MATTTCRVDDITFLSGRTVPVDWDQPPFDNLLLDIVGWLPRLHLESGPPPEDERRGA